MTTGNTAQIEFWNGETGQNWVTHDALMEDMLQPLGEAVMSVLAPIAGERALDIGCGCGHSLSGSRHAG
jgi:2-polyprenyl-3-methyl-5-hydroxy-6-metoxy-1,4-benzoquinol methylase